MTGRENNNTNDKTHNVLLKISVFNVIFFAFPQGHLTQNVPTKHLHPSLRELVNLLKVKSNVHTAYQVIRSFSGTSKMKKESYNFWDT